MTLYFFINKFDWKVCSTSLVYNLKPVKKFIRFSCFNKVFRHIICDQYIYNSFVKLSITDWYLLFMLFYFLLHLVSYCFNWLKSQHIWRECFHEARTQYVVANYSYLAIFCCKEWKWTSHCTCFTSAVSVSMLSITFI